MKSRLLFLFNTSLLFIISNSATAEVIRYEFEELTNDVSTLLFSSDRISFDFNKKDYGDVTVSEVTSIDDAITFHVDIEGYPPIIGKHVPVHISGIDSPEIESECETEKTKASKARQFTVEILRSAQAVELKNIERGEYFLIFADVYVDGKNLAESLIESGHARASDNGGRLNWCDTKY